MGLLRSLLDRFWEWNNRPRDMSASEVSALLEKFLDDTATDGEWDYFTTGKPLADPRLEAIRADTEELFGPRVEPYTSERLRELIARANALAQS